MSCCDDGYEGWEGSRGAEIGLADRSQTTQERFDGVTRGPDILAPPGAPDNMVDCQDMNLQLDEPQRSIVGLKHADTVNRRLKGEIWCDSSLSSLFAPPSSAVWGKKNEEI